MTVRPLHDRRIVQRLDEGEQNGGGIIIPDTTKEKPPQGTVIAPGNGKVKDDHKRIPLDLEAGDRILFDVLTTEAVITQIPEKNRDAAMPGGGMDAGMY
jgi:chaperonin GroES